MPYFKIGRYPVFYSDDRFKKINEPFFEELSAHELISMRMLGMDGKPNKNAVQLEKLQLKRLKEYYKDLPRQDFINKWVKFDFKNTDAKNLAWEIISDYFDIHRNGRIEDLRDFNTKLMGDYNGIGYANPQGEFVRLKFKTSSGRGFLSRNLGNKKELAINIDLTTVERIKGTLTALKIQTNGRVLVLGDEIEIRETVANPIKKQTPAG